MCVVHCHINWFFVQVCCWFYFVRLWKRESLKPNMPHKVQHVYCMEVCIFFVPNTSNWWHKVHIGVFILVLLDLADTFFLKKDKFWLCLFGGAGRWNRVAAEVMLRDQPWPGAFLSPAFASFHQRSKLDRRKEGPKPPICNVQTRYIFE